MDHSPDNPLCILAGKWQHNITPSYDSVNLFPPFFLNPSPKSPFFYQNPQAQQPTPCAYALTQPRKKNPKTPIMMIPQFYIIVFSILSFSTRFCFSSSESSSSSIYDVLKSHGLPMGLLPKGVTDFSLDDSGRFLVHLDQACNAKFENELHYDRNVSGTLTLGKIDGLTGISAQDLFLWFPVKEIRVDVPSSGLIYFDVGVVSKQFSLSSFETPRDCLAVQLPDLQGGRSIVQPAASKSSSGNFRYQLDHKDLARAI